MAGLAMTLLASSPHLRAFPAAQGEKVVFDISRPVVVADPPRFGVNIMPPTMSHWDTEPWHNQWWLFPNPNPITARVKGFATGGSTTSLEDEQGAKIGYYDIFRTGYFDGGTAAVYRFEHNAVRLVREDTIATYQASVHGPTLSPSPSPALLSKMVTSMSSRPFEPTSLRASPELGEKTPGGCAPVFSSTITRKEISMAGACVFL